ncbi:MAG TPA: tRNA lysidine(34) synthetase TilS [Chryseolinea sp.]
MIEQFLNHIDRFKLCDVSDSILLAVSGGVDSMTMLHLFKESGFTIAVAHCNFQLRGRESDEDESFVRDVCKRLGVPVFVHRFDTESFAWEEGLSIQMAARDLRYAWFEELLKIHSFHWLATGHHFDDTMETILLNLTKGSSTDGLGGIPVKNGKIIRPLLFATRAQVEKFARDRGILWREDQSNLTDDYQRNFIRHQIIPRLKELNPSLETTWQHGIEKIQGDLHLLHHAFEEWKNNNVKEKTDRITIHKKGFDMLAAPEAVLWRYIRIHSFNFEQAREIIQTFKGQPGKRFLSVTHTLVVDREDIIITPHPQELNTVTIGHDHHEANLGPWKLHLTNGAAMIPGSGKTEAALDADELIYPLIWRKWKNGDSFQPLGMNHKKKISDFLVDNKLSLADKNAITVIESDGRIAYVVGWRIDDRFKITPRTRRVLNIRVEKV